MDLLPGSNSFPSQFAAACAHLSQRAYSLHQLGYIIYISQFSSRCLQFVSLNCWLFQDVAGIGAAKTEALEIVECLMAPARLKKDGFDPLSRST